MSNLPKPNGNVEVYLYRLATEQGFIETLPPPNGNVQVYLLEILKKGDSGSCGCGGIIPKIDGLSLGECDPETVTFEEINNCVSELVWNFNQLIEFMKDSGNMEK